MRASRRLRSVITGTLATTALVAGSLAFAAAPASADGVGCDFSVSNGTIGVPQTIGTMSCGLPADITVTYANGSTPQSLPVYASGMGNTGATSWAPTGVGAATLTLDGGPSYTVNVGQVATQTIVAVPDTVKLGVATKVQVTVQSQSPSNYAPTGQVVVKDLNGAQLNPAMGLTPSNIGSGQSFAYYWWTPTVAGTYTFQAFYNGDGKALGSAPSPVDTAVATPSGNTISITAPGQVTSGVPVTLTATVGLPGAQGSVGFTVNGQPISASIPLVNRTASFTWTPGAPGTVTLGASYTLNGGGSGSTSQQLVIVSGPASQDVITLTQPGWGTWAPNGTYTLGNGTSFTFQTSTLSGAPVTLSETGPCNLNGKTLIVDVGSGQCNLTATSPGANGYAGVKYGYTINAVPGTQTAILSLPNSGRVQLKKSIRLEGPGQGDTNAGQNIVWSIKKSSKSICKLGFPADGSVTVKLVKKGQCTVYGKAPGVPGQWNPYSITRTYRA